MKSVLLLLILFTRIFAPAQSKPIHQLEGLEIPQLKPHEHIIKHFAYSLSYNEHHEQANWVAYALTNLETQSIIKRGNNFTPDTMISTQSANNADYAGSGYDRGHLAPAADMGWSTTAMEQSFYYSNMSPQDPSFNRGIWKKTEELVRFWAQLYDTIYVITGPVLKDSLTSIGPNKVSVPKYYYKVILDNTKLNPKAIGFIMPNQASSEALQSYAVSIDSVEKVTGINFFDKLVDEREKLIEETISLLSWDWGKSKAQKGTSSKPIKSAQCIAKTKKGTRCKNSTKSESGKCKLHQ